MNQLGDLLFSLPVLAAARQLLPHWQSFSLVRPELAPILDASNLVLGTIHRPRTGYASKWDLLERLKEERFTRAVLFSESPEAVILASLAGIPERVGFESASLAFLLTERASRSGVPSLNNNFNLGRLAGLEGIPPDYAGLVKVPETEAWNACEWLKQERIEGGKTVLISPGASRRRLDKCWGAEKWSQLMRDISDAGYHPVLIGAPSERTDLEALARSLYPAVRTFTAPNGILSLAALMQASRLFVGIDSGAMHLAASLRTKVIGLFGPTDPNQIGPQPLEHHCVIKKNSMDAIDTEEVWSQVSRALAPR